MAQVKKTRLIALFITIPLIILTGIIGIINIEKLSRNAKTGELIIWNNTDFNMQATTSDRTASVETVLKPGERFRFPLPAGDGDGSLSSFRNELTLGRAQVKVLNLDNGKMLDLRHCPTSIVRYAEDQPPEKDRRLYLEIKNILNEMAAEKNNNGDEQNMYGAISQRSFQRIGRMGRIKKREKPRKELVVSAVEPRLTARP